MLARSLGAPAAVVMALILVFAPVASLPIAFAGTASGAPTCGNISWTGSGSDSDPYEVSTVAHLNCIENRGLTEDYELVSDLTITSGSLDPIGDEADPMRGDFYGNGHTIENVQISQSGRDYVGLFGAVSSASVENLRLESVTVSGNNKTGALAGEFSGNVRNVTVTGTVTGDQEVGGLVGEFDGSSNLAIDDSTADVDVDGTTDVGGLVGHASADIMDSAAHGSVDGESEVGGLVGRVQTTGARNTGVSGSYATGTVRASAPGENVGGLVGLSQAGWITSSYATGDVDGDTNVGGVVGKANDPVGSGGNVADTYATGDVSGGTTVGGVVGYNKIGVATSYATGLVTGIDTGGLTGDNEGSVKNAYWNTMTTGEGSGTAVGSIDSSSDGLTTSQMQGPDVRESMTGFIFPYATGPDWHVRAGDYPVLAWQQTTPIIDDVTASNPSGQSVSVGFNSTEQLETISVSLSGPGVSETFTTYDFEFTRDFRQGYRYELETPFDTGAAGTYTFTVDTAENDQGNDGASGQTADVTVGSAGGSPTASVGTTFLSFGSQSVDTTATDQVTIENTGTAPLDISRLGTGGSQGYEFDATLDGASVIDPGQSTAATVEFTPSSTGIKNGDLIIENNDTEQTVSLYGEGVTNPNFEVSITSTNEPVTAGDALTVTTLVENTGTAQGSQSIGLDVGGSIRDSVSTTLSSGDSTTVTLTWATQQGDANPYTATVASENDSVSTPVVVDRANQGPTAEFSINDSNPKSGDTVRFDASASSDPNGNIVEYAWDLNEDGNFLSFGYPGARSTYTTPRTVNVSLRVTDDDGNTNETTKTVTIRENQGPKATFTLNDSSPISGDSVRFDASESADPDGNIVEYAWDLNEDGNFLSFGYPGARSTYTTPRTVNITLRVTDDEGDTNETTKAVTVKPGRPSAAFSMNESAPLTDNPVRFDAAESSDPNGNIVEYAWDLNEDGNFLSFGYPGARSTYTTPRTVNVTLRVTDDEGYTNETTKAVTVQSRDPTAAFTVNDSNPISGDTVRFDASASSDPDGNIVEYAWDLNEDGNLLSFGYPGARSTYTTPRTVNVTLRVTDDDGNIDETAETITVKPGRPSAAFSMNESAPLTGNPVKFDAAESSDPNGNIVEYAWDLNEDGNFLNFGYPGARSTYTTPRTVNVSLRVTDDEGYTNETTKAVTIQSRDPTAAFTVNDSNPISGDSVRFDASESADPDGSIVEYAWDLNEDGNFLSFGYPGARSTYTTPRAVNVSLRVTDDDGNTTETTKTITVKPGRPSAAFSVNESAPLSGNAVKFDAAESADPDGNIVEYAWDLNEDSNFLSFGYPGARSTYTTPRTVNVTLRVTDDSGYQSTMVKTIEVKPEDTGAGGDGSSGGGGGGSNVGGGGGGGVSSGGGAPIGGGSDPGETDTGESEDSTASNESSDGELEIAAEAETEVEKNITDTEPEIAGTTVAFNTTRSLREVIFSDDDRNGSIRIREYGNLSGSTDEQISQQVQQSLSSGDSGTQVDLVTAVDIAPETNRSQNSSTSITLNISRDAVDTPESAVIVHNTGIETWKRINTTVSAMGENHLSVTGTVESFSLFAVVEMIESEDSSSRQPEDSTETPDSETPEAQPGTPNTTDTIDSPPTPGEPAPDITESPSATTSSDGPGFGAVVALLAMLLTALWAVRRSS